MGRDSKDKRERFQGAAIATLERHNPRGERLTPMFLKQGLMLSPPSRQSTSSKTSKIKTREFKEGVLQRQGSFIKP
jgi:hypothetical protein